MPLSHVPRKKKIQFELKPVEQDAKMQRFCLVKAERSFFGE